MSTKDQKRPPQRAPLASPDAEKQALKELSDQEPDDLCLELSNSVDSSDGACGVASVSVAPIVCRICYSTCGTLFAFCKCKGSVGYVHKQCLKRWIDTKLKANKCEICQAPFGGTEWSFRPISKWASPPLGVLDKLYLILFLCCLVIILYSVPWISYKIWQAREDIFANGPRTQNRFFAIVVIAIYVPLNVSCIVSLVVLWRRAISEVVQRFIDSNKTWRVRVTAEVSETRLVNAVNSMCKSEASPGKLASASREINDTVLMLAEPGEASGDSTAMLLNGVSCGGAASHQQL